MRTLPEFLAHFASPRTPCDGERLLVHFLKTCPEAQEAPTLDILLGRYTSPRMTVPALKKALFKRITPELFEASKPEATDLSENLALLWPGGSDPFHGKRLADIATLSTKTEREDAILAILDQSDDRTRDLIIRLITGRFKSPVSPGQVRKALSTIKGMSQSQVEEEMAGPGFLSPGSITSFKDNPAFRPTNFRIIPRGDFEVRVISSGEIRTFSKEGDGPGDEIETTLSDACLLAFRPRDKSLTPQVIDLLSIKNDDFRESPWAARQAALAKVTTKPALENYLPFSSLEEVQSQLAAEPGSIALLLDQSASLGWATKSPAYSFLEPEPSELSLIILYAEGPLSKKGPFHGQITLGAWSSTGDGSNSSDLLPVGKTQCETLPAPEKQRLADFIRENTREKFGPVRQLTATPDFHLRVRVLVQCVEPAPRRKAGLVLSGVQLLGLESATDPGSTDDIAALSKLALL